MIVMETWIWRSRASGTGEVTGLDLAIQAEQGW
jgi:hypothetical protein